LSVGVHDRVRGVTHEALRIMINLAVADVRAAHERLTRAGVVFTRAPAREDWGGWVATFADPDGNTLQLMQLPA
jgi:predicted enzyme related to lactoylglutathione lyase